jgi:hypothetical protein
MSGTGGDNLHSDQIIYDSTEINLKSKNINWSDFLDKPIQSDHDPSPDPPPAPMCGTKL